MLVPHWVRKLFPTTAGKSSKRSPRRRRLPEARLPLVLERLEDRTLLTTHVWSGASPTSANWSDPANWVGNVAPSADDNLVFAAGAVRLSNANDLAGGTRFRSITIEGAGYSIGGNAVTLLEGVAANYASGGSTFSAPITVAAPQTIDTANAGATLVLGTVDAGSLQTLTVDGSGTTTIAGVVSDTGGLTKNGAGTLVLSGANTYLGLTQINQGAVNVQNNSGLGDASAGTTVAFGAALVLSGGITVAEPLAIAGNGIGAGFGDGGGALRSAGGANTYTGGVQLTSNSFVGVDTGGSLNISGVVSSVQVGGFGLTKVGGGTLQLSGASANTYTGTTTVLQGLLQLNKSAGVHAFAGALTIGDNAGVSGTRHSAATTAPSSR